jgi:putative transposase
MMLKFRKNRQYRLPPKDYRSSGDYFITIVTKNRIHYLGEIINEGGIAITKLSKIGAIVQKYLEEIPVPYKDIHLGESVIMPNHIHLVIRIAKSEFEEQKGQIRFGLEPLPKASISAIINHFKGKVTKWCKKNGFEYFGWQLRFHDHIIRSEGAFQRVNKYIQNNPEKWLKDLDIDEERWDEIIQNLFIKMAEEKEGA